MEVICEEFRDIKRKALEVPKSTEQLFENGEYMLSVKKDIVAILGERIRETLKTTGVLMELDTNLKSEHLKLQIEAVSLYHSINNVFEWNASNHEIYKIQFEEKLIFVTKQLDEKLKELAPHLAVINDMTETEKFQVILNYKFKLLIIK